MSFTSGAGVDGQCRLTRRVAARKKREALLQLRLQPSKLGDFRPRRVELRPVELAKARRREHRRAGRLLLSHELLNLREREPQVLELGDPAHPYEGLFREQPVPPLRALVRPQQAQLLIEVDRAHRLSGRLREIPHLQEHGGLLIVLRAPLALGGRSSLPRVPRRPRKRLLSLALPRGIGGSTWEHHEMLNARGHRCKPHPNARVRVTQRQRLYAPRPPLSTSRPPFAPKPTPPRASRPNTPVDHPRRAVSPPAAAPARPALRSAPAHAAK